MAAFEYSDSINLIFEKLENFFKTKTVVGEPIQIGETTLVPFISVVFGMGSGGGSENLDKGACGGGGGAGSGAKISPTAVLVIQGSKVELLPIKKFGGLDKLLDLVPGIIDKIDCMKKGPSTGDEEVTNEI